MTRAVWLACLKVADHGFAYLAEEVSCCGRQRPSLQVRCQAMCSGLGTHSAVSTLERLAARHKGGKMAERMFATVARIHTQSANRKHINIPTSAHTYVNAYIYS